MTDMTLSTIDFHQDKLLVAHLPEGVYVAIKPISDLLGLNWRAQQHRIQRDAILSKGVSMMDTALVGNGQETTWLRLDLVNGWLFGIDERRVKPELKDRVITYKEECYRVLHEHFFSAKMSGDDMTKASTTSKLAAVREARKTFGTEAAAKVWVRLGLPTVKEMFYTARQADFIIDVAPDGANSVN